MHIDIWTLILHFQIRIQWIEHLHSRLRTRGNFEDYGRGEVRESINMSTDDSDLA